MLIDDLSAVLNVLEELGYEKAINATSDGRDAIQRLENFVQLNSRYVIVERVPSLKAIDIGVGLAKNGGFVATFDNIPIERVLHWIYREMIREGEMK